MPSVPERIKFVRKLLCDHLGLDEMYIAVYCGRGYSKASNRMQSPIAKLILQLIRE